MAKAEASELVVLCIAISVLLWCIAHANEREPIRRYPNGIELPFPPPALRDM